MKLEHAILLGVAVNTLGWLMVIHERWTHGAINEEHLNLTRLMHSHNERHEAKLDTLQQAYDKGYERGRADRI